MLVLVAALIAGTSTRALTSTGTNGIPDYEVQLAHNVIAELRTEGKVDITAEEVEAFVEQNKEDLKVRFAKHKKSWRAQKDELRDLLRTNYRPNELEPLFPEDPRVAEHLTFLVLRYDDGARGSVFVDAADWPTIFQKGIYGYGAENAFKADLVQVIKSWKHGQHE